MTVKQQQKTSEEGYSQPFIVVGCCISQQGKGVYGMEIMII
jgi:hypothetical protein